MKRIFIAPYFIPALLIFGFCFTQFLFAQEEKSDFQTWIDWTSNYQINQQWRYFGDYGVRGLISGEEWFKVYINPKVARKFRRKRLSMDFVAALAIHMTFQRELSNTLELRPWQGIRIFWPTTALFAFNHYFRIEERLTIETQSGGADFAMRGRYRIEAKSSNWSLKKIGGIFYGIGSFEVFGTLGRNIEERYVNRSRLNFALGYFIDAAQKWRVELHYTRQGSRRNSEEGIKTSEHILRVRIKTNIN